METNEPKIIYIKEEDVEIIRPRCRNEKWNEDVVIIRSLPNLPGLLYEGPQERLRCTCNKCGWFAYADDIFCIAMRESIHEEDCPR